MLTCLQKHSFGNNYTTNANRLPGNERQGRGVLSFGWCGDPRGDRCIATLACLALLRRRLLNLTSSGWLTFPNEPPPLIRSSLAVPTVLLSGSYYSLSPIVILCPSSSRADRLLSSLKEFNTAIVLSQQSTR